MKVELRTAKVLTAERVPKSKKLLKLSVDVGTEQRTLVAGIAEAYEPETLIGRTVVIVFNLQPATLMGVESNGMVLAASPEGGKPMLLSFETPPPPGQREYGERLRPRRATAMESRSSASALVRAGGGTPAPV